MDGDWRARQPPVAAFDMGVTLGTILNYTIPPTGTWN